MIAAAVAEVPSPAVPEWPAPGARLRPIALPDVRDGDRPLVWLDPGHGAPGNTGNTSVRCEAEADVMRRLAAELTPRMEALGRVTLGNTRPDARLVAYRARLAAAEAAGVDAMIGLHSDARAGDGVSVDAQSGCLRAAGAAGFSVLWSDEGDAPLVDQRRRLARSVAARLREAGFPAYRGADYPGLYVEDAEHPGVFVDRHLPRQRIMMLRRSRVPYVIVETHQALDPEEVARWEEPATWDAFAAALVAATFDASAPPAVEAAPATE